MNFSSLKKLTFPSWINFSRKKEPKKSSLIKRESLAEDDQMTGAQLFGFALLKFFTVFAGSLSIGAAISMLTALLFKVWLFCEISRFWERILMEQRDTKESLDSEL